MHAPSKGFTLVEVMVTVVVAGIIAAIALPSLSSWYDRARADSEIRKIQDVLKFARNQAFSYGAIVEVCPNNNSDCGTDWSKGILVRFQNSKEILKVIDSFNKNDALKVGSNNIAFRSDGLADAATTFVYCPNNKSSGSKSLSLSSTGLIKTADDDLSCQ
ncbi:GspH/FimT family pseudopilin [Shewanella sp. JM162201]|uniref:Type II secretion system protein H n=1 Tax=Shewanella jiangmenensis TaxID=2837387 RepID=A0ABS5UZ97_9GAMM|nr:GspH/FimT family pseudopilin [Shewanella jiangmenensis]MBT1443511.1 GspH/FimT family pseudopilin [Shewanella jiangmenensis]